MLYINCYIHTIYIQKERSESKCDLTSIIFLGLVTHSLTSIMSGSSGADANLLAQSISSNIQRITLLSESILLYLLIYVMCGLFESLIWADT